MSQAVCTVGTAVVTALGCKIRMHPSSRKLVRVYTTTVLQAVYLVLIEKCRTINAWILRFATNGVKTAATSSDMCGR